LFDPYNIVVIADEAHRSQYDFIDDYACYMRDVLPTVPFIAFTGTALALANCNMSAVFDSYTSIYDIQRMVDVETTAPICYERRLAKLDLPEEEEPKVDKEFEEETKGERSRARNGSRLSGHA
jgi:type I restriction enzyme R subunit